MNEITKTFFELVQIYSPTGKESKLAENLIARLESMGLSPTLDKHGNVLLQIGGSKKAEPIFLTAHMDTVEPSRNIKPKLEGRWIKSSGNTILGADNKMAIAAILNAMERIVDNPEAYHPLEIVFTVSEESGNLGTINVDLDKFKSKFGYCFDISNQPQGNIVLSSPFYNRLDINIEGKTAHASRPDLGINVLTVIADAISKIKLGKIDENTIANIGIIKSGEIVNAIPGKAYLGGEVRSSVEENLEETTSTMVQVFKSSAKSLGAEAKVTITRENGGYKYSEEDENIQRTIKKLSKLDIEPEFIHSWSISDANIFAERGIRVINIAEGSLDAHSTKERVKETDLINLVKVIEELVRI